MLALAPRLTDRDRTLLDLLWDVRVLTSEQIAAMLFGSPITARHRLATLARLGLIHPFRPQRPDGNLGPAHYLLDHLGSYVVAAGRGADPETLDWRKDRALAVETSQRLAHLVGVNGVLADLYRHARHTPGAELRWLTERQFTAWWQDNTVHRDGLPDPHPDAYGVWQQDGTPAVPFVVEYDRGTETLDRLAAKLPGYAELAWVCARPVWVLFAFTTEGREANARDKLRAADPRLPIATATLNGQYGAHEAVWQSLEHSWGEQIADLTDVPRTSEQADFCLVSHRRHRDERPAGSLSRAEWDRTGDHADPLLADLPPLVPRPRYTPIRASKVQDSQTDRRVDPVIGLAEHKPIPASEVEDEWWAEA